MLFDILFILIEIKVGIKINKIIIIMNFEVNGNEYK